MTGITIFYTCAEIGRQMRLVSFMLDKGPRTYSRKLQGYWWIVPTQVYTEFGTVRRWLSFGENPFTLSLFHLKFTRLYVGLGKASRQENYNLCSWTRF